jgi:hypothetical protein
VAFLLVGLLLGSSVTPWPWAALWWVVPMVVAASLLLAWRHGAGAWVVTAVLLGVAVFMVMSPDTGIRPWHVMWLPLAAVTGTWMGLREEGRALVGRARVDARAAAPRGVPAPGHAGAP